MAHTARSPDGDPGPDRHSGSKLPTVCILAGGRGTRLGDRAGGLPKPLVEVAGQPFLLHQLRSLAGQGVRQVVLCVGHRGELIEQAIGKERFGTRITYSYDGPDLDGTLGALRRALPLLGPRFLVLYGDTYLQVKYAAVDQAWLASGKPATMTVLRNASRWDVSNAVFLDGMVQRYDKHLPTPDMEWIDYGLSGFTAGVLDMSGPDEHDLANLQSVLASKGLLCGFEATERFHEIGTPEALEETDEFLRSISSRGT